MKDEFDPNRTPFTRPAPGFSHYNTVHGLMTVNETVGIVLPIENGPNYPVEIPVEYVDFDQPHVHTCSPEKKDHVGIVLNRGCPAWNGCAIVQWFKDRKYRRPTNVIVERNGRVDSAPCFHAYCGISSTGRPTSQTSLLNNGWKILEDRTTIPQKIKNAESGRWEYVETEVPNLAPFYDKLKEKPEPPKKRGRPKKNAEPSTV